MSNSTRKRGRTTADVLRDTPKGFALSPHPSGMWQKKINGHVHYFGRWGNVREGVMIGLPNDGRDEAERLWDQQKHELRRGQIPTSDNRSALTVNELCLAFLRSKRREVEAGDIVQRTLNDYAEFALRVTKEFGESRPIGQLTPEHFAELRASAAKQWGPRRLSKYVQCVRTMFKFGTESRIISTVVHFGPEFKRSPKKKFRQLRAESAKRLFTATEIRQLLNGATIKGKFIPGAGVQLRAMILLGINNALGNTDVAELPISAVNFENGILEFPRPKNSVPRRSVLWPETIAAILAVMVDRREPKKQEDNKCVFITREGNRWVQGKTNSVTLEFTKLLRRLKISPNGRLNLGFLTLRHTARTVADATRDFPAVRLMMGHTDNSIDNEYREEIADDRLHSVADHVHAWLFEGGAK